MSFYLVLAAVLITVSGASSTSPGHRTTGSATTSGFGALFLLAAIASTFMMRRASIDDRDFHALLWLDLTIAIMAGGMFATLYPDIVPGTWTVVAAASPEISLFTFLLTLVVLFPVMIMYNWYQIWVFRARVAKLASFHH